MANDTPNRIDCEIISRSRNSKKADDGDATKVNIIFLDGIKVQGRSLLFSIWE